MQTPEKNARTPNSSSVQTQAVTARGFSIPGSPYRTNGSSTILASPGRGLPTPTFPSDFFPARYVLTLGAGQHSPTGSRTWMAGNAAPIEPTECAASHATASPWTNPSIGGQAAFVLRRWLLASPAHRSWLRFQAGKYPIQTWQHTASQRTRTSHEWRRRLLTP